MVGCKDDDTCDQPATKGEIETLQSYVVWGLVSIFTLVWINNSKISRVKSHTDEIHQYGTVGAPNLGAMRDKHAIRELLEETPRSRKSSIRAHNFHEWEQFIKKGLVEDKENPYRD